VGEKVGNQRDCSVMGFDGSRCFHWYGDLCFRSGQGGTSLRVYGMLALESPGMHSLATSTRSFHETPGWLGTSGTLEDDVVCDACKGIDPRVSQSR
jgi:hypothetical protein